MGNQLQQRLISENFFHETDLKYISNLLMIDVLSFCPIYKWYFVEWHEIKGEYFEYNKVFKIIEIKQMIIGHFKCCNQNNNNNNNKQLFICWSIEWQQINDDDDDDSDDYKHEMSISSTSKQSQSYQN